MSQLSKMSQSEVSTRVAAEAAHRAELRALRSEVAEQAQEIEALEEAILNQMLYLLDGYIITVYPTAAKTHIASCPTLRASVEAKTAGNAIKRLRRAMTLVQEAFAASGVAVPEKDTKGRCLDSSR